MSSFESNPAGQAPASPEVEKPTPHFTLIDSLVQSIVEKSTNPLTDEEKLEILVPPIHIRKKVEAIRKESVDISHEHVEPMLQLMYSNRDSDKEKKLILEVQLGSLDGSSQEKKQELEKEIQRLNQNINNMEEAIVHIYQTDKSYQELLTESNNNTLREVVESYIDYATGVYTRQGAVSYGADQLASIVDEKESLTDERLNIHKTGLGDIQFLMTDKMLFHSGNQRLTPLGFDKRIRTLMRGHLAVSRYLSDSEDDLYTPYEEGQEKKDPYFEKYFKQGSDIRKKLDELKLARVVICPIRLNAGGGDEFLYMIKYKNAFSSELGEKASEIINHIIRSTTLSPRRDVIEEGKYTLNQEDIDERELYVKIFTNNINDLRIQDIHTDESESKEIEKLNKFIDLLRLYYLIRNSNPNYDESFHASVMDPNVDVHVDYSTAMWENETSTQKELPNLKDAMSLFLYGTDAHHRIHKLQDHPIKGIINDETGEIDEQTQEEYTKKLAKIAGSIFLGQDLSPEQKEKIVREIMYQDIINTFIEVLNEEVNGEAKPEKKREVMVNACNGDMGDILTVGAMRTSGRLLFETTDRQGRIDTIKKIQAHFEILFKEENKTIALSAFEKAWAIFNDPVTTDIEKKQTYKNSDIVRMVREINQKHHDRERDEFGTTHLRTFTQLEADLLTGKPLIPIFSFEVRGFEDLPEEEKQPYLQTFWQTIYNSFKVEDKETNQDDPVAAAEEEYEKEKKELKKVQIYRENGRIMIALREGEELNSQVMEHLAKTVSMEFNGEKFPIGKKDTSGAIKDFADLLETQRKISDSPIEGERDSKPIIRKIKEIQDEAKLNWYIGIISRATGQSDDINENTLNTSIFMTPPESENPLSFEHMIYRYFSGKHRASHLVELLAGISTCGEFRISEPETDPSADRFRFPQFTKYIRTILEEDMTKVQTDLKTKSLKSEEKNQLIILFDELNVALGNLESLEEHGFGPYTPPPLSS